ncbi:MAG: LysM domain-containing protein [Methylocella sp.]
MDNALASLITSAAGTGAPTNTSSRYYGAQVLQYVPPGGAPVKYLARRIIPQPDTYTSVQNYVIGDGDRLDNLAARFIGDPLLYWMICDANGATDPDELTQQAGRTILIPLAAGIPAGARNG